MDRRQKKTREAIFSAFTTLLSEKHYHQITVGEIIEKANIGRATFYAHFETKDYLLKALCEELFCHIFDATEDGCEKHQHIFACDAPSSVVLHLLQHLQKNDNNILDLLGCENNELFLRYFKENLKELINSLPHLFGGKKPGELPADYWSNHISVTFVELIRWWLQNGMKENPQTLTNYFYAAIYGEDKSNN
ncbi:MAG: TetR/AcrR family transcriptional regulator [Clostridia bacterium]|nr:TetR/AcrR family transcriptional regulator [Clostridia bacterium]